MSTGELTAKKQPELQLQLNSFHNAVERLSNVLVRIENFNDRMHGEADEARNDKDPSEPSSFLSKNRMNIDYMTHLVGLLENETNRLEDLY